MKQNKELVWNVYMKDLNSKTIKVRNILSKNSRFYEDLYKLKKEYLKKDNFRFEEFMEEVRHWLMYYYWSRCEYETIITSFPAYIENEELDRLNGERDEHIKKHGNFYREDVNLTCEKKIDVYEQVILNWEGFKNYLLHNYELIKRTKKL